VLALPYPALSLAYLFAVRSEWVAASFVPLVVMAALPVASIVVGWRGLRTGGPRAWHGALIAVAALDLVWAVVASAMVGFSIAWRSG
jgi:hypothetical protein